MKVKELIALLQQLENQEWEICYLDGEYGKTEVEEVSKEIDYYLISYSFSFLIEQN